MKWGKQCIGAWKMLSEGHLSSSSVRSQLMEEGKEKCVNRQFSSPTGHRNHPMSPPFSCLTHPHTSHPRHLELGPERIGCGWSPRR